MKNRKIVVINQATNYLTIGFCNAFSKRFDQVALITGSIHSQGEELDHDIHVHRINKWHASPAWKKALSYLRALGNMWWLLMTRYRHHEVFFISVPPMGYLLNLLLPHRFSMVIWDVFPDAFKITGMKENHLLYKSWSHLNKICFKKAFKVFTISEKMAELIAQYVAPEKIIIQPIWSIFQENERIPKEKNTFIQQHQLEGKFIVQYSGNIGLTHNVEVLLNIAEYLQDEPQILIQIIGRGPRKAILQKMVTERNLPNCQFLPFQSDEMFPYSLSAADVGAVILDESTSKGSVPSKSYNLMSYGIPSLYIASTDSQLQLYANKYDHAACYTKAELKQAVQFIRNLKNDSVRHGQMSKNAETASLDFRRNNADKFVSKYFSNS